MSGQNAPCWWWRGEGREREAPSDFGPLGRHSVCFAPCLRLTPSPRQSLIELHLIKSNAAFFFPINTGRNAPPLFCWRASRVKSELTRV